MPQNESGTFDEIKCTCGDSFKTMNEYFHHAREVHGVDV